MRANPLTYKALTKEEAERLKMLISLPQVSEMIKRFNFDAFAAAMNELGAAVAGLIEGFARAFESLSNTETDGTQDSYALASG